MPKLKIFSGTDIVKIFIDLNFSMASQKGSHIKLQRISINGEKQIIIIPNHSELDKGTIKAVYRQALRYIPEDKLKEYFYTQ